MHGNSQEVKLLLECTNILNTSANLVQKYSEEPEKSSQIDKIKSVAKEFCLTANDMKVGKHVLKKTQDYIEGGASESVDSVHERFMQEAHKEYDYTQHVIWRKLLHVLQEGVKEEVLDESVICSQVFQVPIDQLTKKPITNPVKNQVCGHVYESETITNYIKAKETKSKIMCPYVGCTNEKLQMSDIVIDDTLKSQITDFQQSVE